MNIVVKSLNQRIGYMVIMDFVKRINEEKLVDKEIIDYGISWNDESLTAHFYDKDYYNPHEDKTDGELPPF